MAALSIQLVISMVFASIFSKIVPHFSLARWLLASSGLVRYLAPEDQELRQLAGIPAGQAGKGAGGNGSGASRRNRRQQHNGNGGGKGDAFADLDVFNVPRNLPVVLDRTKVTWGDLAQLRFYNEYQWLVDFSVYALLVYATTEAYVAAFPARAAGELNLSMVSCLLVAGSAFKALSMLTGLYFRGSSASAEGASPGGERSLVMMMFLLYLLAAMVALVVDEEYLETGLDHAYESFNRSAAIFLADNAALDSSGPASKLVLKFFLALWCALLGSLLTFPGLRLSRMQWDAVKYSEGSGAGNVLLHASFISPLLVAALWIRPLGREYLTERTFKGMTEPFMTSDQFETLRLYLVLSVLLLRLAMMPRYLQSYLNMAYHKMEEMKAEAGKISNIDLQKSVAFIFYYLCVVTIQYVAPVILLLFLTLMYKTMGGGSWSGLWAQSQGMPAFPEDESPATRTQMDKAAEAVGENFSLAWQSLKQVFTPSVYRGLLGFSTWWCCLVWFASSAFGTLYQSYFSKV